MLPYYVLVGLPALIAIINRIINSKHKDFLLKKLIMGVFFAMFIILLALRGLACGIDLVNYKTFFDFSHYRPFDFVRVKYGIELGYHFIEYIIAGFTQNFQVLLAVIGAASVIPVWIMYSKESSNPFLTIVLFLTVVPFTLYFSGIRQALAMAFIVPAYYCAKNKKLILFIIITIISVFFHASSLVIIVIYPLYHVRITKKWLYFTVPIMVLILIYNEAVFGFLLQMLVGKYMDKYVDYETAGGAYMFLTMLVAFAVFSFVVTDDKKIDGDLIGLRNLLLLAICIQCFAPIHPLAMRMNYYFLPFIPILISKVVEQRRPEMKQIVKIAVLAMSVFFTIWFVYDMYTGEDILQVFPYVPFWR